VQNHIPLTQGEIRHDRGRGGERHALRTQGRQLQPRVDHGIIFRSLAVEDAQFRGAVGGHIRVAVQMVCAEVGPDRYPWPEGVRGFQLERADFDDGGIEGSAVRRHFAERQADVAAGFGFEARGIEQRRRQSGRRRLPVGAGDGHDRAAATAEGEFDFAEEGNAGFDRPSREWHHGIDPGAEHREVKILHAAQRVVPQNDARATRGKLSGGFPPRSGIAGIEHGDGRPALEEQARRSRTAPPEAEHGRMFSRVIHGNHRSFKVASPSRAKMTERIQNRTMTVLSFHPLSSK
jgi:hypothetical protein